MATYYWIGPTGSCSFTSMANWSATEGGAAAAGPLANGDILYMNRGTSAIDSGLASGLQCTLYIAFQGSIGTSSASLQLGDSTINCLGGSQTIYINSTGVGTTSINIFENASPNFNLTGGAGTVTLDISGGYVTVAAAVVYFSLNLYGGQCQVAQRTAAMAATSVRVSGGNLVWGIPLSNALDTVAISGGTMTYNPITGTTASVTVTDGGVYYHQSAGTITALVIGAYGTALSGGGTSPFTVTNSSLYCFGAMFQDAIGLVTYTNPTTKVLTRRLQ